MNIQADEFKGYISTCGSCINFKHFMGEAGFCSIAEHNCVCMDPCVMIDMWDTKCDKWSGKSNLFEDIETSITGCTCPYCDYISESNPIIRGEVEFDDFEGTYFWDEVHECSRCGNLYRLENGT